MVKTFNIQWSISINKTIKKRGNNVNVQLNVARTRHRKVFPEERTHTQRDDQLTAPILTHTTEQLLENINNDGPPT